MICEKCGHPMTREFKVEEFTCQCREFIVENILYKSKVWANSAEEAAKRFAATMQRSQDWISILDGQSVVVWENEDRLWFEIIPVATSGSPKIKYKARLLNHKPTEAKESGR